jgi:hypothetical protein
MTTFKIRDRHNDVTWCRFVINAIAMLLPNGEEAR